MVHLLLPSFAIFGSLASAFPTLLERDNYPSDVAAPSLNITYSSPVNDSLPNTLIFATGGTIAGSSQSDTDATDYSAGTIGVEALVEAVPQLLKVSNVDGIQVSNVASGDITSDLVLNMSQIANYALCRPNSNYTGLVITHGTDTLEETAFAMDITVNCGKPVVVVGAMRPATAISADGPANLLSAVSTAVSPESKDRGALVVLNDRIGAAFYTQKRNANVLDTFRAEQQGYLGGLLSFTPFYYFGATQPSFKKTFSSTDIDSLPQVDIIYCHQEYDFQLISNAMDNGAKGLVLAGTGAGSIASGVTPYLEEAEQRGVPVVVSTKTNAGAAPPRGSGPTVGSGFLNPVKSRIQLQFAMANNYSMDEIREAFEGKLADYLA